MLKLNEINGSLSGSDSQDFRIEDIFQRNDSIEYDYGDWDCELSLEADLTTDEAIMKKLSKEFDVPKTSSDDGSSLSISGEPYDCVAHATHNDALKSERSSPISSPDSAFDSNSGDDWSPSDSPSNNMDFNSPYDVFVDDPDYTNESVNMLGANPVDMMMMMQSADMFESSVDIGGTTLNVSFNNGISDRSTQSFNEANRSIRIPNSSYFSHDFTSDILQRSEAPDVMGFHPETVIDDPSMVNLFGNVNVVSQVSPVLKRPEMKADPKFILNAVHGVNSSPPESNQVKVIRKAVNSKNGSSKIMLTADEFRELTAKGLLKMKNSAAVNSQIDVSTSTVQPVILTDRSIPKVPISSVQTNDVNSFFNPTYSSTVIGNASCSSMKTTINGKRSVSSIMSNNGNKYCTQLAKKQQRMIKNRESACLSRKKKKEHVTNLEDRVKCLTDENSILWAENHKLKMRLTLLEQENEALKNKSSVTRSRVKTTCVLAIMLIIGVNLSYLKPSSDSVLQQKNILSINNKFIRHHSSGRSLLSLEDVSPNTDSNQDNDIYMSSTDSNIPRNNSMNKDDCPPHVNSTESRKYYGLIHDWLEKQKKISNTFKKEGKWPSSYFLSYTHHKNLSYIIPSSDITLMAFNNRTVSHLSIIITDFNKKSDVVPKVMEIDCIITNVKTFVASNATNSIYSWIKKSRGKKLLRHRRRNGTR